MHTVQPVKPDIDMVTNAAINYHSLDSSDGVRSVFELVNLSVLTSAVCLLGIVSNLINLAVFYAQGMRSTVNISFMALSVTDLCNVMLIQWISLSAYPLFMSRQDLMIFPQEVSYVTAGLPHSCLTRITAWITAYLAAERCLCIAMPFKVKRLITPRRTVLAMMAIYVLTSLPMIPQYLFFHLDWKHYPELNKTLIGLSVNPDYISLDGLSLLIYSIEMVASFITVIFLTLVLILQLNKMAQWRNDSHASGGDQSKLLTQKDKMAVRTVVVIACVLIVTFTPSFAFCGVCFIVPGFALRGEYNNIYIIFVSFVFLFDAINASVNTILYFSMNTGYRLTLLKILSVRRKR